MKDIADFDIAPKSEKAQVEGEEDNTEVDETTGGESESRKLIYQEMLKNKKIIYVAGRLMLIFAINLLITSFLSIPFFLNFLKLTFSLFGFILYFNSYHCDC